MNALSERLKHHVTGAIERGESVAIVEQLQPGLEKERLYRTAKARISCAKFSAGEYVSVFNPWRDPRGVIWFTIQRTERGKLPYGICYPMHHLTDFCL